MILFDFLFITYFSYFVYACKKNTIQGRITMKGEIWV